MADRTRREEIDFINSTRLFTIHGSVRINKSIDLTSDQIEQLVRGALELICTDYGRIRLPQPITLSVVEEN